MSFSRKARRRLSGFEIVRVVVALGLLTALACSEPEGGIGVESVGSRLPPRSDSGSQELPDLGVGFLVWESNRSGDWRIWTRELADSEPGMLTPDTAARQHCCPHISPNGRWIAYLSLKDALSGYAAGGNRGELRLIRPDGSGDRLLAASARASYENRAVVWRGSDELLFLRGDGATALAGLDGSDARVLIEAGAKRTWLVNSRLSHAASGLADFSPFDPATGRVAPRTASGGCQSYFTHDGRWGFWTAGTGGPIRRIELESGRVSTVLEKSDERIPDGLGYAYFPMFSADSRLFAFAASAYEHDHFEVDYEVFVAESDPETLVLSGEAVRMTRHPATDRFPDVYLAPLALGRHSGEAPLSVTFEPPARPEADGVDRSSSWTFDFGDGSSARGARVEHVFETPGIYEVSAREETDGRADEPREPLSGRVRVRSPRPPQPVAVFLEEEGRRVVVRFDEEIEAEEAKAAFASGRTIEGWSVAADRRSLIVRPRERIAGFEQLTLEGVTDRALTPNRIEPTTLEIEPPLWPSNRERLAFLWETGDAPNLVRDPALGTDRASTLEARGRARLDRHHAMVLDQGAWVAAREDALRVFAASTRANALALEAVVTPRGFAENSAPSEEKLQAIVSFAQARTNSRNFLLAQRADRLVFGPRAGSRGATAYPLVELARVVPGTTYHVLLTYAVGRRAAYVNGEPILDTDLAKVAFFHWKPRPLVFGADPNGGRDWAGTLEGVAIYGRFIEAVEARENYLRYRRKRSRRAPITRLVVDATLLERSGAPDLSEISPYREALSLFEYRVDRVLEGKSPGPRLRVAEWTVLDGRVIETDELRPGARRRLALELFADNPQLESVFVADELGSRDAQLFYSVPP